ncbi:MAG TPA: DUF1800 domain-containing protein [Blastocatellia bacterium]|nr:DUF1800 domain-containing protein [Blastocatellia bacterium]
MGAMTYEESAHLLRRMGFGGPPEEIDDLAARGREGAVDYLLNFSQIDNRQLDDLLQRSFDFSNPGDPSKFNGGEMQRWWFTRLVHTRRQFEEKLTLFWHNHFATAISKVPDLLMFVQNVTLRQNALGRFDDLLLKVAQDPAMLVWLDGITSVRGKPNENFARELQELFTMGITDVVTGDQNYTEDDVKEIARAFTGWKPTPSRDPNNPFGFGFIVNPGEHDNGTKTVYGQTANFGGEDIITIIAARRATARFLARKMLEFFAYPLTASSSDKATIEKFADVYLANSHSIKEVARAIFTSDEFFSDRARFALVKSSVELIVGAIRMLGARYNPGTSGRQENANILAGLSGLLGQELFNPPDVSGWPHGLGWINTANLLMRFTYADFLAIFRTNNLNAPGMWLTQDQLQKYSRSSSKKTVKNFLSVLGPLNVDSAATRALRDYLQTDDRGSTVDFVADDLTIDKKVRGLVHQIMCLSEFQLN